MKDSDRRVFTLQAAEVKPITAPGTKCFIESSSFPFVMQFDGGNTNVVKPGVRLDFEDRKFSSINVTNPSATKPLTVVFWVGNAFVDYIFPFIPPTALVATKYTIAGGVALVLPGFAGTTFQGSATTRWSDRGVSVGNRRKQFVVSNRGNNTNGMTIQDEDGNEFGAVEPNTDYTLETDATIKVVGTNGDVIRCAEVFYL